MRSAVGDGYAGGGARTAGPVAAPGRGTRLITTRIIDDDVGAQRLVDAWDELACATGRPFASPLWLMAWWRHLAPEGAVLRVVTAWGGQDLVGVLPLVGCRRGPLWFYETLGVGMVQRGAAIVRPGDEERVGAALADTIRKLKPAPAMMVMHQVERSSRVDQIIAHPRGWRISEGHSVPAPLMRPHPDGFDAWLALRPRRYRKEVRRIERRLHEAGGRVSCANAGPQLDAALDAFDALHAARWGSRSPLVGSSASLAVREAMRAMALRGRAQAWVVTAGDHLVAVDLVVGAGSVRAFWNGGWDKAWATFGPGVHTMLAAIRDAHESGVAHLDVGPGDQEYKRRYADVETRLVTLRSLPYNPRGAAVAAVFGARAVSRRVRSAVRRPAEGQAPPHNADPSRSGDSNP